MIPQITEYKKLVTHRLEENLKSFKLLFGINHYGNCISIMCQELDQIIRLLYLLNQRKEEQIQFMESSINSHRWYLVNQDHTKKYITDEDIIEYSKELRGWDKSIYEFGIAFDCLSNNFNYGSKNPIKSMNEIDRKKLSDYIIEYHKADFPDEFTIDDLIPILPSIIKLISEKLTIYLERL
jgi:hypothetical protein